MASDVERIEILRGFEHVAQWDVRFRPNVAFRPDERLDYLQVRRFRGFGFFVREAVYLVVVPHLFSGSVLRLGILVIVPIATRLAFRKDEPPDTEFAGRVRKSGINLELDRLCRCIVSDGISDLDF